MKLSLNDFRQDYNGIKAGGQHGYETNEKNSNLVSEGMSFGVRHLKMAFSKPTGFEFGLARLGHIGIGLLECIPVIGTVTAWIEKFFCEENEETKKRHIQTVSIKSSADFMFASVNDR